MIKTMTTERLEVCLTLVKATLDDMKAKNVTVLNVEDLTDVMERIVIADGTSKRHVRAMADSLGADAKKVSLDDICSKLGITAQDAMAVGDGANDLPMIKHAGSGVALHAKPAVAAQARIRIDHGDLTALLYIKNKKKTDFVT